MTNQIIKKKSKSYLEKHNGKIPLCPKNNCGFKCCQFQQGNYIVLYPGELEEAKAQNKSVRHLKILVKDRHGGSKAICTASNTSSCDNGYKPLDCAFYPLFPKVGNKDNQINWFIKGIKCPLQISELHEHIRWVLIQWNQLIQKKPLLEKWLYDVRMIGYEVVNSITVD